MHPTCSWYMLFFFCALGFLGENLVDYICRECFYYICNFISSDRPGQMMYFFLIHFGGPYVSRNVSISSRMSNLLGRNGSWGFSYIFLYFCSIHWDFSLSFLMLLIWFFSLLFAWWVWPGLVNCLYFSKNQLLFWLIFSYCLTYILNIWFAMFKQFLLYVKVTRIRVCVCVCVGSIPGLTHWVKDLVLSSAVV